MSSAEQNFILRIDEGIRAYARKYDGRGGAEYDDLHQEGRVAALIYYRSNPFLKDYQYISRASGRMIDWCKYCKRGHNNNMTYHEELVDECDD